MKMSRFFSALLALIILACSFGVQGQYTTTQSQTTSSITSSGTSSSTSSQYSQYYGTYGAPTGSASSTGVHIGASMPIDITAKAPSTVYLGSQNQAVPYGQYTSSTGAGENTLWIQNGTSWTQYLTVPQGTTVTLIANSPGGKGYLNEIANGLMHNFDQVFYPPSSQLTFYADTVGQHTLYFMLNGQPSNKVVVSVTGNINYYEPPWYYMYPDYYSGYYPYYYYPGYYSGYYPRYYSGYSSGVSYNVQYSGY